MEVFIPLNLYVSLQNSHVFSARTGTRFCCTSFILQVQYLLIIQKDFLFFLEGTLWFSFERELEWKRNPRNSLLISSILEVLLTLSLSHSHSHHLNLGHNSMPTLQNPEWVVVLAGANAYKLCDTDCSYCDTYWSFSVTLYIYFFYQLCYYEKKKK